MSGGLIRRSTFLTCCRQAISTLLLIPQRRDRLLIAALSYTSTHHRCLNFLIRLDTDSRFGISILVRDECLSQEKVASCLASKVYHVGHVLISFLSVFQFRGSHSMEARSSTYTR